MLRKDPVLRAEARGGLLRALPLAVRLCSGRAAPMDAAQISAMARCLQKIAARGSTALKADMVKVLAQIEDQSIFKELGIAAEKAV
ncbi:MAG: hypothetical protein NTV89_17200, partial [Proteobacteria bacterium]|nr:hypothetical protein [Pseudomonadota bacterium]